MSLELSHAGLAPTHAVEAFDEYGQAREVSVAGERPLTLYLDRREIVTLMTLGSRPEALVIGYLLNQGLIHSLAQLKAVQVDWDVSAAVVVSHDGQLGEALDLSRRTVTTGCGQGTVFGDLMARLDQIQLPQTRHRQSDLYALLHNISQHNEVYRQAGAVHGCALCRGTEMLDFVEDVGRHNAVDALAGQMLLDGLEASEELIFYTTGRLTSEMVIKVAQMGIALLLSRSGITAMGLELGQRLGVAMIGRAKGKHFMVYHGRDRIEYDAVPSRPAAARPR